MGDTGLGGVQGPGVWGSVSEWAPQSHERAPTPVSTTPVHQLQRQNPPTAVPLAGLWGPSGGTGPTDVITGGG